ncbi:MAG: dTDP-4-dehydrorhamnose reductase [Vulcanimicrobiaceae bacterium]
MALAPLLQRVLLIGGTGQLGSELRAVLADAPVTAPARSELDVEQPARVAQALRDHRPTLVINTSAFHHVETCEAQPERAFAVNALAVDRLAAASAAAGAAFATFSSDYVFDGRKRAPYAETDATAPLNAYGASKLAGEHLTRRHGDRHFIIRTSGLYGPVVSTVKGYTFIDRILRQAAAGEPLRVVDDVVFSPSYAVDVARAVRGLIEREAYGTYHISNAGACSWYDFAVEGLRAAGLTAPIERTSARDFASAVRRPGYSPFAHEGIARAGLAPMPSWQAGLRDYLTVRRSD